MEFTASGAHAIELADGAAELALDRAQVIGALHEVGDAEVATVEYLEADRAAGGHAFGREVHAHAVDVLARNVDRGAAAGELVGDRLRVERGDDVARILGIQAAVEQLHVRS
jgi:hypothetical protein